MTGGVDDADRVGFVVDGEVQRVAVLDGVVCTVRVGFEGADLG